MTIAHKDAGLYDIEAQIRRSLQDSLTWRPLSNTPIDMDTGPTREAKHSGRSCRNTLCLRELLRSHDYRPITVE